MKTRLPTYVSDALFLIILAIIVRIFLPILVGMALPSGAASITTQKDIARAGDLVVMGCCLYVFIRTIQCFLYGTFDRGPSNTRTHQKWDPHKPRIRPKRR